MKKTYLLVLIAQMMFGLASAQTDTLLWENFESENLDYIEIDYPTGQPNLYPTWLNFDVDGISDGSGSDRPDEWFLAFGFADADSSNTVLASNSWLQGEADGAENWLISPRIHIQDNQAMLYWKSAPFQLPRYLDGYQVLVSTTDNIETSFTDTLAVFAEFDGNLTTNFEDTATYVFTSGIMHTALEYDSADVTRHTGVLQQWEASLADYEGQNIFIAFRHRSDDDNLLSIDDILVLGTGSVGINEQAETAGFNIYPNPITDEAAVVLEYELTERARVSYSILSMDGRLISEGNGHIQMAGAQRSQIDVSSLAAGTYVVNLRINGSVLSERLTVVH